MSRLELERLTLGPARFANLVKEPIKYDLKGCKPAKARTFHPRAHRGGKILLATALRLLPGGGHLVTWMRPVGTFPWDLGLSPASALTELPSAHLPSKPHFMWGKLRLLQIIKEFASYPSLRVLASVSPREGRSPSTTYDLLQRHQPSPALESGSSPMNGPTRLRNHHSISHWHNTTRRL